MQFVSALLEHFIVGILSLVWIVPLLLGIDILGKEQLISWIKEYKEILVVLILPVSYVIGIYIDIIASLFTRYIKTIIYRIHWKNCNEAGSLKDKDEIKYKSYERTAQILKNENGELARYLLMLSGREKIARGIFLNSLITSIILTIFTPHQSYSYAIFCVAFAIVSFLMWMRLNILNNRFKTQALCNHTPGALDQGPRA